MNRGSQAYLIMMSVRLLASMRPRFMNRGSPSVQRVLDPNDRASMRPRFMNRGSNIQFASYWTRQGGFNEAPIHESGKYCGYRR